jgi:hypothetical protein
MEPHAFGVQEEAAEILCILDHDGTRTHLGPGGPFPETGPEDPRVDRSLTDRGDGGSGGAADPDLGQSRSGPPSGVISTMP